MVHGWNILVKYLGQSEHYKIAEQLAKDRLKGFMLADRFLIRHLIAQFGTQAPIGLEQMGLQYDR